MELPSYRYEALGAETSAIRILELLPSEHGELICQLQEVSLDHDPNYTALSYCWGAKHGTLPIKVRFGDGDYGFLNITPNLNSFLDQFTLTHPDPCTRPRLWVDALCINQEDVSERSAQVAIMQNIFQKAERVIIWLGEGDAQTQAAMNFVHQLIAVEQSAMGLSGDKSVHSRRDWWKRVRRKIGIPEVDDDAFVAVFALCQRDWFQRIWIIQEVAMAKEALLTCGLQSVSWDEFVKAFHLMLGFDYIPSKLVRYSKKVMRVQGVISARELKIMNYERDLLGTLLNCRLSLATDPRDKVFGLLGLTPETGPDRLGFRADYALEVKQVYTEVAFAVIEYEQKLDVLGVPRKSGSTSLDLASWIPDWSTCATTSALNGRDRAHLYSREEMILVRKATGDTRAEAKLSEDTSMLGLQGYVFDTISEVGMMKKGHYDLPEKKLWIVQVFKVWKSLVHAQLQWEHMSEARSGKTYGPTGEDMLTAYWKTITAGLDVNGRLSSESYLKWDSYYNPGLCCDGVSDGSSRRARHTPS